MAFNLQTLSVCALSLLTGFYIGHYIIIPSKTTRKSKKSSSNNSNDTSFDSSPTSVSSNDEEYDNDESFDESEEEDYQVDSTTLNSIPGETRMALVVRTDLKMTKGKAAAQCAHAALGCYRLMSTPNSESENLELLRRWERSGQAKITLQAKSKEDLDLLFARAISLNVNSYIVHDAGRTQIEAGSATVLGLGPAPKIVLDQITGDLKLY